MKPFCCVNFKQTVGQSVSQSVSWFSCWHPSIIKETRSVFVCVGERGREREGRGYLKMCFESSSGHSSKSGSKSHPIQEEKIRMRRSICLITFVLKP